MKTVAAASAVIAAILAAVAIGIAPARGQGNDALAEADRLTGEAFALQRRGQLAEAEALTRRAIGLREGALGLEHPTVASGLDVLAGLLYAQGKHGEVEAPLRRAILIRERTLGPEHPDLLIPLENLAALQEGQGRYADAEPLYRRVLAIRERTLGPDHPDVAASLNDLATLHYAQSRYADAVPLLARALRIWERTAGPLSPNVASTANNLAAVYRAQGKLEEAEPLYRRALAITERALGPQHPEMVISLSNLAGLLSDRGQTEDAEQLYRRAVDLAERVLASDDPKLAVSLVNLAATYRREARYADAEPLYARALGILERALGPEHPRVLTTVNNLASLYETQGRYREAEPLFRRVLTVREKVLGPDHADVGVSLNNLGELYRAQGRRAEAEALLRRALDVRERALGPEHPDVAQSLNNLAGVYRARGLDGEAAPLLRRALAIWEHALGPEHPIVATSLNNLAELQSTAGKYDEAEPLFRRALLIWERSSGSEHPDVAVVLSNLSALDRARGRYAEAEALQRRALAIRRKSLGPAHPDVALSLNNLAVLHDVQGRYAEAEPLFREALALREAALGPEHPEVAASLNNLAAVLVRRQQPAAARPLFERARRIHLAVLRRDAELPDEALLPMLRDALPALHEYVGALATIARQPTLDREPRKAAHDAFVVAEQARTGIVQAALAKAGARTAAADPAVVDLARTVEDLRRRGEAVRRQITDAYGTPIREGSGARLRVLRGESEQVQRDLRRANEALRWAHPGYAELTAGEPAGLPEIESLLRPAEALLSFFALSDRLLIWVLRPGEPAVYSDVEISRPALVSLVRRVRATMDQRENPDVGAGRLSAVDVAGAHELFRLLIQPVAPSLRGVQHLIIVPDGALQALPFGALVTRGDGEAFEGAVALHREARSLAPAELTEYAKLSWLAGQYAITVLPSATSLRALRGTRRTVGGEVEALIGFGDPRLDGRGATRGGAMLAGHDLDGLAAIRRMPGLPGTRDELLAVARAIGADPATALYLDARATKPALLRLNAEGRLARAAVLAFATHALTAGELREGAEPGLVLTPPLGATEAAEALLTVEDILTLRLTNAEWAILSACNTAAADASGEGLSGIARAFFFAGARSLLVSHWSVDDRATQALMTAVFGRHARERTLPRSEILRGAMLEVMASARGPTAYFAHPFAWAPFFLVGEGAPPLP
jgi:tetratricopeptide (TPR) repeat protein